MISPDITLISLDSPSELTACYPLIKQLRPHLSEEHFLEQVRRQATQGYCLAALTSDGEVYAVAGYRFMECLARGKTLYIDDLVVDQDMRSYGFGEQLFDWLVDKANAAECDRLDLDSGIWREDAQRFYFNQRMSINAYHFTLPLSPQ